MNRHEKAAVPPRATGRTRSMVYVALFALLMGVCAWISIPSTPPFTMQTFAVFLAVGTLGGRRGTLAVLVYLLMGAVGMPVFSHFQGGLGVFFQVNGGYLIGLLFAACTVWGMESLPGGGRWIPALSMVLGQIVCYALGTAWYMMLYAKTAAAVGLGAALLWCVVPYVVPDLVKLSLALIISQRLSKLIKP